MQVALRRGCSFVCLGVPAPAQRVSDVRKVTQLVSGRARPRVGVCSCVTLPPIHPSRCFWVLICGDYIGM